MARFEWPCDRREAHGPHDGCPGVKAHPNTMIGGASGLRCRHGNVVITGEGAASCGCMVIDGGLHPCEGCPSTCGNCL